VRAPKLLGVLAGGLGQDLAKCPDWPQRRQRPRLMRRCRSTGVSRPSAPKMLLMEPLYGGVTEGAPGNDGELGSLSIWLGLSSIPGVLATSGLGDLIV